MLSPSPNEDPLPLRSFLFLSLLTFALSSPVVFIQSGLRESVKAAGLLKKAARGPRLRLPSRSESRCHGTSSDT